MDFNQEIYLGIDPGAVAGRARRAFTYAALDNERRLLALGSGDLSDILTITGSLTRGIAAINGPACLNRGLQPQLPNLLADSAPKPARMRQAEHDLRARGLKVPATPGALEACPQWMAACLHLFQQLHNSGFASFPMVNATRLMLETQAEALFSTWCGGGTLLAAGMLEGRLQRQLALNEQRLPVHDPMDFFEEITRHKLLRGNIPMDRLYSHQELNALAAAALAWQAGHQPERLHLIGNPDEGVIYLLTPGQPD